MTTKITRNGQKGLPYPQTKMTHCPQCGQKYNTEWAVQVWCDV